MKKIFTIFVVFITCFLSTTSAELFAFDNLNSNLVTLDPVTGNLISVVGNTRISGVQGMTFDPNTNTMFIVSNATDSIFSIDTTTGLATLIGSLGIGRSTPRSLEFDTSTKTLFLTEATEATNANLFTVDPLTGQATLVGNLGIESNFGGLAYDPTGDTLFLVDDISDSLFTLDRTTGNASLVGGLGLGGAAVRGVTFDQERDSILFVDDGTDNLFSIDKKTGLASVIGNTGTGTATGLSFGAQNAVPEPSTYALLAFVFGFFYLRRRNK